MPRRIVTRDGKIYRFVEYDLPEIGPKDVRVKVEFAAPKHGTEAQLITGSVFSGKRWDSELRLFLPPDTPPPADEPAAERGIGNMVVGIVTEVGPDVTRWKPGDRVFGKGFIREMHQAPEDQLHALEGLTPEDAVCTEPAHVGFVAIRDGNVRLGDDVAVFGLGAIGLLTVQVARAAGAFRIFGVDPLTARRELAANEGANGVFDPLTSDAALEIKLATARKGVDVALETSGNAHALHDSIRCLRQCGTVVHVAWGPKAATDLHLNEEFHHNRPQIIGSQAWEGWGNPDRAHPLWNEPRAYQATIDLFRRGLLTGKNIVTPIVPFDACFDALATIFTAPEKSIKVGVRFS